MEGISIGTIERTIGASRGVISKAIAKGTDIQSKWLELICQAYPSYSPSWLLTGQGDMYRSSSVSCPNFLSHPLNEAYEKNIAQSSRKLSQKASDKDLLENLNSKTYSKSQGIPLVSVKAVGGFAGKDFLISESDIEAYYVIPKFRNLNVDFMIEVVGDSMMPRLFPGDIIACSIVRNSKIIQWNKTYLIATEDQGMIVKRLKKSTEKDSLLAVSDNSDYDPFDIPLSDITGLARVVGVIHAE